MKFGRIKVAAGAAAILIILLALTGYSSIFAMRSGNIEVRVFDVPEGMTLRWIANSLEDQGIIGNSTLFMMASRVMLSEKDVKAGEYLITPDMSLFDILSSFRNGRVNYRTVTVLGGYNISKIGEILEEKGLVDTETFRQLTLRRELIDLLNLDDDIEDLEGFLYPDTYYFVRGGNPERIVRKMMLRFKEVFGHELEVRAQELGITVKDVVTLASLIEKEAVTDNERPIISAVFHNRLKRGMPLQSDPTVIYALGDGFDGDLKRSHLSFKSLYNTYVRRGLPPGPIGSPTIGSIRAALYPADVDHLYFVSKNDGTHHFSKSLREHNRAVAIYQKVLALKKVSQ